MVPRKSSSHGQNQLHEQEILSNHGKDRRRNAHLERLAPYLAGIFALAINLKVQITLATTRTDWKCKPAWAKPEQ